MLEEFQLPLQLNIEKHSAVKYRPLTRMLPGSVFAFEFPPRSDLVPLAEDVAAPHAR